MKEMATNKDNELEETSEVINEETTPAVSRAQSNYSTQRTKILIAPAKYGENRAQYLWRLLRCSVRRTIEAVSRADDTDIERSHGLHFVRNINHDLKVKCISFNIKRKEIISIDYKKVARIYHSDGRAYKKVKLDFDCDQLFYCVNEDEFIAWTRWNRELHILSYELEILSTSKCDYNIGELAYNEVTSEVFTCGRGVTIWQFRYNRKHLLPKYECREGYPIDVEFSIMAAEQTEGAVQRLFVTSGYDITTFNVADGGKVYSTKQDLHVRPMVAMLFIEQRDVLVTAARDGSIKVWDRRWFILYAYVGHQDRILCLSKHPFGPYIISSSQDRTLRVWSLEHGDVLDVIKVPEPASQMNVTRNYEKFILSSTKCLQLWCIKHYCDFMTFVGSPVLKTICTTHPNFPTRATLLCKDSTVRIVTCGTGHVLTSLVCDLNFKPTSCAYAIAENILFVSNGSTLIKADTSTNPCKVVQQFEIKDYTIDCLLMYEYVTDSTGDVDDMPMLKSLVTKPSSELVNLALKGFSRTLLIAGLSNGCVTVLNWNTGARDFFSDMHSARPVVDMIANPSSDQIISCGVDLIIRIWRVFPYAVESLSVVRSIFCGLPPVHLAIAKNFLAVAFREETALIHSLMIYSLESNERFDHLPENDHCDKVTAISGCSKLKLIATGSLDGTLRIWNSKNQLIRMVVIHDSIYSLHFSNESGDLVVGIGDHLYKMSHLSYLPKSIIFKTVSMEFKAAVPEGKQTEEIDNTQIIRMSSADLIRFKRAHKAEQMQINVIPENSEVSEFHARSMEKMKLKNLELEKLEKRDIEIAQIAEGKILRTKKYKISSKVRKEAFNEYMKLYLKEPKKGLLDEDMYKLNEQELFGPPTSAPDPYVIMKDDEGFFPSVKEAKQDPLSILYEDRQKRLSELQEYYQNQSPFLNDDIRIIKQQQEKYELKKLLHNNLEKITLPSDRPHYGPGAIVPNSVLAKLLWPNRQPKKQERVEWVPPALSEDQLKALDKTEPVKLSEKTKEPQFSPPIDEEAEWKELIQATLKKKLAADEDEMDDRLEKQKKKVQSDFMKQLTDLAQQTVEPIPQPEPVEDDGKRPETEVPVPESQANNRLSRQAPLRRPPGPKAAAPSKPARIPVKTVAPSITDSTQTIETRAKTPRQLSPTFVHFIDKLKELNWFEEQYPLVKIDVFLETCDENAFPIDVLQRLDFIAEVDNRLTVLHELENFYASNPINEQTRETLVDKILFQFTKFNPPDYNVHDIEFISAYLRLLSQMNKMNMEVVAELIYWYLEGGDRIRNIVKNQFQRNGLDDPFGLFYNEMDSWKLWELDPNQPRRSGIKTLANEWLRQWVKAFRTHVEEMHFRLKNGDIHVQISKATSKALVGDTSLVSRSSTDGKNLTVTLDLLPRLNANNISFIDVINYFVEITQEQMNERNQPKEKPENNTILVLPKVIKQTALVRLGESHTDFHRPTKRNPIFLPYEHRFEPGDLSMGRCVSYPVRKLHLDPFRRQIFTEDIEFQENEPYLLTLKLAPKYFLPVLSQVAKT